MKNKVVKFFILTTIVFSVLASCNLQLPKRFKVKASPKVTFNLGSTKIDVSKLLEKKLKDFTTVGDNNADFKIYNYKPKGNSKDLKFLIHKSLKEIDFDMTTNLSELDKMKEKIAHSFEKKEFKIPKIEKEEKKEIPLNDVSEKLLEKIAESTFPKVPYTEQSPIPDLPEIAVSFDAFREVTFDSSSSLILSFDVENASSDFNMKIKEVTFLKEDGTEIVKWDKEPSPTANIDISNKTLYAKMKVNVKVTSQGGRLGNIIYVQPKLKFEGAIKRITGASIEPIEYKIDEFTIPVEAENFKSALIGEGKITHSIKLPDGWENFQIESKISLLQEGGLNIVKLDRHHNLANQKINNGEIKVSGAITVTANNATYVNNAENKANFTCNLNIKSFKEASVILPSDFKAEYEHTQDIAEIKKWVKSITFNELLASITLTNSLPIGNDIQVSVSSKAFEVPQNFKTFAAGCENNTQEMFSKNSYDLEIADKEKIDIFVAIKLPNYDNETKTLTLKNIKPGETISFEGKADVKFDWTKAVINPGEHGKYRGSYPEKEEDSFEIEAFKKYENLENLALKGLKGYLYLNCDFLSKDKDAKFMSSMDITYKSEKEGIKNLHIIGEGESAMQKIKFVDKLPDLYKAKDNIFEGDLPSESAQLNFNNVKNLLKDKAENLKIKYIFKLDEITVTKDQLKGKNTKLFIDLILELPFNLNVTDDVIIPLPIGEDGKDILGRQNSNEEGSQNKLNPTDMLKEAAMRFDYKNTTGLSVKVKLFTKDRKFEKEITLTNGSGTLSLVLNGEDVKYIQKTVPFALEAQVVIPKGEHKIKNESAITLNTSMYVHADVDYAIN